MTRKAKLGRPVRTNQPKSQLIVKLKPHFGKWQLRMNWSYIENIYYYYSNPFHWFTRKYKNHFSVWFFLLFLHRIFHRRHPPAKNSLQPKISQSNLFPLFLCIMRLLTGATLKKIRGETSTTPVHLIFQKCWKVVICWKWAKIGQKSGFDKW